MVGLCLTFNSIRMPFGDDSMPSNVVFVEKEMQRWHGREVGGRSFPFHQILATAYFFIHSKGKHSFQAK